MTEHPVVRQLRSQLDETDRQITQLTRLRTTLALSLQEAQRAYGTSAPRQSKASKPKAPTTRARPKKGPGPKDTLRAIIKAKPGITIEKLLDTAEQRVSSGAGNKRRSLMETLRAMRNDTKEIRRDAQGGHYLNNGTSAVAGEHAKG